MDVQSIILLEHDGLIVVNKPAGLPTAGDDLEQPGSLQFELMRHFRRTVWAVHQLDRDTSGLNLFVRRKALVAHWTDALKAGTKRYVAVCVGQMDDAVIDAPLGWIGKGRRGVIPGGKAARTEFITREQRDGVTIAEVVLHTGRTHQIRIHAAHAGHPVVGDERYGASDSRITRQALHAWRIEAGGLELEAPLPGDLRALVGDSLPCEDAPQAKE